MESEAKEAAAADTKQICIIDLGSQDHTRIRKLRRGQGRLLREVREATEALQAEGVLEKNAQVVVVLVREKPSVSGLIDRLTDDDDD
ncbi:MAG: hypothetical protein AB7P02_21760 [Alphaproteobacteria bacterium]